MGEIRSTLDIIMEKAKGLTVTEEEKTAFQRKETEGKIRGFLQKFVDGLLDLEGLKKELDSFGDGPNKVAREALVTECLNRLEPDRDNTALFQVLEGLAGVSLDPLRETLRSFQRELEGEKGRREKDLAARLKKRGVSGSAVIPNILSDSEWVGYSAKKREAFHSRIGSLEKKLLA
jgi:hypothetical protein